MNIVFYLYVAYKLKIGLQYDLESVIRFEEDSEMLLIFIFFENWYFSYSK